MRTIVLEIHGNEARWKKLLQELAIAIKSMRILYIDSFPSKSGTIVVRLFIFLSRSGRIIYFQHFQGQNIRGRPLDSEGGGLALFGNNILPLKMLELNKLSSSGKKINNLTLTC